MIKITKLLTNNTLANTHRYPTMCSFLFITPLQLSFEDQKSKPIKGSVVVNCFRLGLKLTSAVMFSAIEAI